MSDLFPRLRNNFKDEDYRHIYTNGLIDSKIATQLKVLREEIFGTQERLAEKAGMRQARISVMEDVNYSSWSLSTLRRLAKAFDLYVDVEFKEFGTIGRQLDELSRNYLSRRPFKDDPIFHAQEQLAEPELASADLALQDFVAALKEELNSQTLAEEKQPEHGIGAGSVIQQLKSEQPLGQNRQVARHVASESAISRVAA
jgi:transcriptional regulator with XRE-family HTH domain